MPNLICISESRRNLAAASALHGRAHTKGETMASEEETRMVDDGPAVDSRRSEVQASEAERDEKAVVGRTVTIDRPREEIYAFWRHLPNLVGIMENLERIDLIDDRRSHWVVKAPGGRTVEWDSEIVDDEPGQLLSWRSVEGSEIRTSGRVEFLEAPPGRGTYVRATIAYDPPGGVIGEWIAKLLQREPNVQARRDLRRLKQFLETGEVTSSASPSGRKSESPTEQAL
jgi:uncharacterized membrane protein